MSSESLCSFCKLDVSEMQQNNQAPQDTLITASNSLSQMNLDEDNPLDFDQETLYFIDNQNNLVMSPQVTRNPTQLEQITYEAETKNDHIPMLKETSKSNTQQVECSIFNQHDFHCNYEENDDFLLRMESSSLEYRENKESDGAAATISEPPTKHCKTNKETQTHQAENAEFSSKSSKLFQIQKTIYQAIPHTNSNSTNNVETLKIPDLDCREITELVNNRKRQLRDVINSVYETSCYLDKIKNALTIKGSPTKGSVKLAPTRVLTKSAAYENHFDFPVRSLFHKLPITIKSFNKQTSLKRSSNASPIKLIHNKVKVSLPSRLSKQKEKKRIEDLFSAANKENELITPNPIQANIMGVRSTTSGQYYKKPLASTNDNNESMYDYNPLALALRKTKKAK